ncbi:MarR family winged helix-turn-helix transcriptional regulator [Novosphingobium sp.]|uniref:MarR family winged helix-turn-helix transcriptional regulator n=1 Tax=Novosphingobium sp. TaxID=1874826 RepID=UPI003B52910A
MKQDGDLETILGYQLQRARMVMSDDARRLLEPYGLTPAKLTALLLIRANPGCDQSALGRALSINRSSVMKLVNLLTAQGDVERRAGRNLRTNAVHLLPSGQERLATVLGLLRESEARLTERLSPAEHKTLFALLRKLSAPKSRTAGASAGHAVRKSKAIKTAV